MSVNRLEFLSVCSRGRYTSYVSAISARLFFWVNPTDHGLVVVYAMGRIRNGL